MVCVAAVSDDVVNVAWPEPSSATALAITVAPSLKLTVPVGVPAPPVTVAVNVTDCPKTAGFCEETRPVAETTLFTVTLALGPAPSAAATSVAVSVCEAATVPNVKLDSVPEPATSDRLPDTPPLSSAIAAATSELLIATSGIELPTTFQLASTALTRTLLRIAAPMVWAVGVPDLPVAVPGAAVSPGSRSWSLTTAPASTVRLELGCAVAIAGEVADVALSVVVSALRSVVARAVVELPAVKLTFVV